MYAIRSYYAESASDIGEIHAPVATEEVEVPGEYALSQNYPNPFNPSTRIGFSVASREFVSLKVYSLLGQEVVTLVNEMLDPGNYEVTWDTRQTHVEHATELASGVY